MTQAEFPFRVLPGGTNSDYKGFVRNQFPTECKKLNLALGHLYITRENGSTLGGPEYQGLIL